MYVKSPLIQRRKNRQTGAVISVWRPGTQSVESEGYMVINEEYGTCICTEKRQDAIAAAANPLLWCPESQAKAGNVAHS